MSLTPPNWCQNAVPTRRGWVDPQTGELLKSTRISDIDLQEYRDRNVSKPQVLTEAPPNNTSLDAMSSTELDALSEQQGIDLNEEESTGPLFE